MRDLLVLVQPVLQLEVLDEAEDPDAVVASCLVPRQVWEAMGSPDEIKAAVLTNPTTELLPAPRQAPSLHGYEPAPAW